MRKIISIFLVCGLVITLFSGCALLDRFSSNNSSEDELSPVSSVTLGEETAENMKDKTPVKLYFINEQGTKLSPETRYVKIEAGKGSDYIATVVLKELIAGPAKGSTLKASIPQGTTVHADVTIKDGIATVDLSKEFVEKHQGGKKNEQLTLYSIVNSLTEIKDIKSVQFRIAGKVTKEFKGSYQIDIAYPRAEHLISDVPTQNSTKATQSQSEDQKTSADVDDADVELLE